MNALQALEQKINQIKSDLQVLESERDLLTARIGATWGKPDIMQAEAAQLAATREKINAGQQLLAELQQGIQDAQLADAKKHFDDLIFKMNALIPKRKALQAKLLEIAPEFAEIFNELQQQTAAYFNLLSHLGALQREYQIKFQGEAFPIKRIEFHNHPLIFKLLESFPSGIKIEEMKK